MIKKLLLIGVAVVGGIYLTSDEGRQARAALMKKKSTFEPIVKDLLRQLNDVLANSEQVNSDEIRANINLLVKEAKQTIVEIDLEKTVEMVRSAIKVAAKKIREAENEVEKASFSKPAGKVGVKSQNSPKLVADNAKNEGQSALPKANRRQGVRAGK